MRRWIEAVLARQPGKEDPRDGRFVERNLGSGHWAFASWLLGEVTPTPALDEFVRLWDRANEPA